MLSRLQAAAEQNLKGELEVVCTELAFCLVMSAPPSGSRASGESCSKDVEEYKHDSWYPYLRIVQFDSIVSALPLFTSIGLDVVLSITVILGIYGPDPGKVSSANLDTLMLPKSAAFVSVYMY